MNSRIWYFRLSSHADYDALMVATGYFNDEFHASAQLFGPKGPKGMPLRSYSRAFKKTCQMLEAKVEPSTTKPKFWPH